MKGLSIFAAGVTAYAACAVLAGQSLDEIRKMEASGSHAEARSALAKAVQSNPRDTATLTEKAEFVDRYAEPAARDQYARLLDLLKGGADQARAGQIARRLVALDLLAGDNQAAAADAETY